MPTPSILIIGLDGATWRLLEPWARAGRMPHLAALMARGAWGTLRSTVPPQTLPAWSSFMTGRNPGAHGVWAFRRPGRVGYGPGGLTNASDLRARTLWDIAGAAGKRVGVINVPPSYPIRPVNGFVVSCLLTPPGEPFTDPPDVAAELPGYTIDLMAPRGLTRDASDYMERALAYLGGLRDQTRGRADAALRLMSTRPTDVLCVVFYAPDRVQHYFWQYLDDANDDDGAAVRRAAAEVYTTLDDGIGRLVAAAGPEAFVILLSDHGFGPKPERAVHVNRWLADHGFLRRRPLWRLRRKIVRRLLPPTWRTRYDSPEHIMVHRARSAAWCESIEPGTAGVWLHVAGRYPLGFVPPGREYENLRARIQRGLSELRDERGEAVFRTVQRREDLYRGPYTHEAPDLVAVCGARYGLLFHSLVRDLRAPGLFGSFDEAGYTGTHDDAGLYLFAGPAVRALGRHADYPIEAIAPTVLHLLGLAVPRSMEAPVCTAILDDDHRARHPVRYVDDADREPTTAVSWRSERDEAEIADRLRALGYLA